MPTLIICTMRYTDPELGEIIKEGRGVDKYHAWQHARTEIFRHIRNKVKGGRGEDTNITEVSYERRKS